MSMTVEVDSINLLTKIIIDCCSIVDINIDVVLSIKTSKIDKMNLTSRKNESSKSSTCLIRSDNELMSKNKSETERNFCVLKIDDFKNVELLLIKK